ncbi:MAG: GNAT family N-acetyltransferase [Bacteroidetes bacterium]|nr:GNAT family N-acetyltransferase [Bacteroidota bacterium]
MMTVSVPCPCSDKVECESIKNYQFIIHHSADEVNALQWNHHVPERNVLMQHESLQLLEQLHKDKMQFKYVLVQKENNTIGVIYFQVVMFHANQLINYFPDNASPAFIMRPLKSITEKVLNAINLRLLVSGNVFMTGENGFYFSHETDKAVHAKLIRQAAARIQQQEKNIQAVLISDLYEPKTDFDSQFLQNNYHQITVESDMSIQLNPNWETFDDYMNALSSKYRVRAKKVLSLCKDAGVTCKNLDVAEIEEHSARIYELYNHVMRGAEFKLSELNKEFFAEQKKSLPRQYHVFGYFKEGKMLGFISAFVFGKRMEVHYTGMEHELTKPIHLYQHMMYDMIQFGIENRVAQLHFGRTAPEIKSTIGAVPSAMYGYLKHKNALFNFLLVKPYTANLVPQQYTFRNPFKTEKQN